jgi:hypothetical protein
MVMMSMRGFRFRERDDTASCGLSVPLHAASVQPCFKIKTHFYSWAWRQIAERLLLAADSGPLPTLSVRPMLLSQQVQDWLGTLLCDSGMRDSTKWACTVVAAITLWLSCSNRPSICLITPALAFDKLAKADRV